MNRIIFYFSLPLLFILILWLLSTSTVIEVFNSQSFILEDEEVAVPLEEKIGQLFIIGHWADTPLASTTALITKYSLGAVGWENTLKYFMFFILFGLISSVFLLPKKDKDKPPTKVIKKIVIKISIPGIE